MRFHVLRRLTITSCLDLCSNKSNKKEVHLKQQFPRDGSVGRVAGNSIKKLQVKLDLTLA